ncbi:MAG TPA: cysteine--tRNA ligase, partial [Actinomycetota bacterium]|nr:cysteine--tRNA ligase [Actinomycetota bacterium]
MPLVVTNTLTRRKDELVPREPGKIAMYVCGPTVYNHIHIGNARCYICFDVIRRYLQWRGYDVTYVQNHTDVDDKIIAKANEEGRPAEQVAADYSRAYEAAMHSLEVSPPTIRVLATEHIKEMIEMIEGLIEKGFAYESSGNVWFDVAKFEGYGSLSGRSLEDVRAGERVEPDPTKRHPLDFSLWKRSKEGEPAWDSPWGPGRPGWHIECSAMSLKYLGMSFDIHGGGSDLIFPHHENEIAQSEAYSGDKPFVNYWLHNGMVNLDEQKMSKSVGNFILVKDLVAKVPAPVIRLMSIAGHYRSEVDFSEGALQQARRALERFDIFLRAAKDVAGADSETADSEAGKEFITRFTEAMDDDFNTPAAIRVLHDLVRRGNAEIGKAAAGDVDAKKRTGSLVAAFDELTGVLGISPHTIGETP